VGGGGGGGSGGGSGGELYTSGRFGAKAERTRV